MSCYQKPVAFIFKTEQNERSRINVVGVYNKVDMELEDSIHRDICKINSIAEKESIGIVHKYINITNWDNNNGNK